MNFVKLIGIACLLVTIAGCGQQDKSFDQMSRAEQLKTMKGDPSKMPDSVKQLLAAQSHPAAVPPGSK